MLRRSILGVRAIGAAHLRRSFHATRAVKDEDMHAHTKGAHDAYTTGEKGDGFYSLHTKGCFDVIANAKSDILNVLAKMDVNKPGSFNIADFGTADGGTSMPTIADVITDIRKRADGKEIVVQYEDQITNDWHSLFNHTQGLVPGGPRTYLKDHKGVFVSAAATSFFEQVFPSGSIDLSVSFTAMHWLSKGCGDLKSACHHTQAPAAETKTYAAQAAKDWERILTHRANELAVGGRCVYVNFCTDAKGQYLGNTSPSYQGTIVPGACKENMHGWFNTIWQEFRDSGKITAEEYNSTVFPNYYRTPEEMVAPFQDPNGPVSKAGLKLISSETRIVPCSYRQAWLNKEITDPKEYAKTYVPTTRTWSNATFFAPLSESRPLKERLQIVDDMYQRYEDEVAKAPENHGMDYVHCYLICEKV